LPLSEGVGFAGLTFDLLAAIRESVLHPGSFGLGDVDTDRAGNQFSGQLRRQDTQPTDPG
jgi:hypothetical protein